MKAYSAFDGCDINQNNSIDTNELKFLIYAYEGDKPDYYRCVAEIK